MMLSVDDVQFLTIMSRGEAGYLRDYFVGEIAAAFPEGGIDPVLGAYMAFLGRTVIRNGAGILTVDPSDSRPFEAMVTGSNPANRFYGIVDTQDRGTAQDRLERIQRERRSDCCLYRMGLAEALTARLLQPADLAVFTNIRDAHRAGQDLRTVLETVVRAPGRVILHGLDAEVGRLIDAIGGLVEGLEWEFRQPSAAGDIRFAALRVQAAPAAQERGAIAGRRDTAGFDAVGPRVDAATLTRHGDHYAEVVPAGHIRDMASDLAAALPEAERPIIPYDALRCAHLRGARLIGHSAVIDRQGRLLSESLCAQKDMVREGHYWEMPFIAPHGEGGYHVEMPAIGQHCYRTALLLTQAWEENYQHWLFEVLPQVIAAWHTGVDTVIVSSDIRRYQRRALELLGFTGDRIVTHDLAATMYCDSLLAGSFTAFNMGWVHPAAFAVYDRLMEATKATASVETPELVYISRSDAEWKRRLLNEGEVIERLSRLGFVAVNPGALGFDDEVQVLSKAKVIVGAVGAGMSNMVFAPRGAQIVAIQSPSFGMHSRFFPMVATLRNQRWHSVTSMALNPMVNGFALGENDNINIIVDADQVVAKVEAILAGVSVP